VALVVLQLHQVDVLCNCCHLQHVFVISRARSTGCYHYRKPGVCRVREYLSSVLYRALALKKTLGKIIALDKKKKTKNTWQSLALGKPGKKIVGKS